MGDNIVKEVRVIHEYEYPEKTQTFTFGKWFKIYMIILCIVAVIVYFGYLCAESYRYSDKLVLDMTPEVKPGLYFPLREEEAHLRSKQVQFNENKQVLYYVPAQKNVSKETRLEKPIINQESPVSAPEPTISERAKTPRIQSKIQQNIDTIYTALEENKKLIGKSSMNDVENI